MDMFQNYITSAWRNILRHKLFSFINILGLAIGLAAVMLIALYVRYESSYDSFWKNADNIYRMQTTFNLPGTLEDTFAESALPLRQVLIKNFPQIEKAARVIWEPSKFTINNQDYPEYVSFVDHDIMNIFDCIIIAGDIETTLKNNNNIALNETIAAKYFGENDPIGKVIKVNVNEFERDYIVSAIFKDLPTNSHLNITAMAMIDDIDWEERKGWFRTVNQLFYTLKEGAQIKDINDQMVSFIDKNFPPLSFGEATLKTSSAISLQSLNIKDIHLKANANFEHRPPGNFNSVIIFSVVAFLILAIASINFINLSTAKATSRAKEVSLRKVSGASRTNLITQFVGESILITLIALFFAIVLVEATLPIYSDFILAPLSIDYLSTDIIFIIIISFIISILGGIYPALILSNFRPAHVLKANKSLETNSSIKFRAFLVITQFTISIALFVSTAVIYSQIKYSKNMDLGYTKENLLTINDIYHDEILTKLPMIIEELGKIPGVKNISWANFSPAVRNGGTQTFKTSTAQSSQTQIIGSGRVGYDYFKTMGIKLIAGRDYRKERNDQTVNDRTVNTEDYNAGNAQTGRLIINEAALSQFGFTTAYDALNKTVFLDVSSEGNPMWIAHEIIGIVPDVHFESLKTRIRPEVYQLDEIYVAYINIRYSGPSNIVIDNARYLWQREIPSIGFDYDFTIDSIANQYEKENGEMTMLAAFSSLAIFIACLGLFGLASFTAERRTKEIGIRKVFGAEVWQIVKLLVWQFSKPVIIANLIAWPLSFYAMSRWLESFVYRIDNIIIIAMCLIAGLTAILIAWATVAGNSYAVARQNPIKALRYE